MHLSDITIREHVAAGTIGIDPYDPARVQPASYDVTLGNTMLRQIDRGGIDAVRRDVDHATITGPTLVIPPRAHRLATTVETITISAHLSAQLRGKSSLARLGLIIESAGFIDPGFTGQITLELYNLAHQPITLHPGQPIGQLVFEPLDRPCESPYGPHRGSRYQGQAGPTGARA